MFSSRKARNKRSFTTVQIVSGQLLSATVNPEQPVDISRILAAANKRCSAYCHRLPKGSATMPALAGMIYNIQLIRFTIYTIPCNGRFVYDFSTTVFLYRLLFAIILDSMSIKPTCQILHSMSRKSQESIYKKKNILFLL